MSENGLLAPPTVPKHEREISEGKASDIFERVALSLETALTLRRDWTGYELATHLFENVFRVANKRMWARIKIIEEAQGKPVCWLCGYRVFLDEPPNSWAQFTLDHVTRTADGGLTELNNVKPAHALCNSFRHNSACIGLKGLLKSRAQRKLDSLIIYITNKEDQERTEHRI